MVGDFNCTLGNDDIDTLHPKNKDDNENIIYIFKTHTKPKFLIVKVHR